MTTTFNFGTPPDLDNQREEEIRSDEQSGVDGQCQTQTGRGGQKGTGTLRVPNPPTLFERPK